MEIARERFLDDTRRYHVTVSLRSRTTEAHSVLTALTREERDAVARAIARALDDIATIVAPHVADDAPSRVNG
jgi:hypothetical protein